MSAPGIYPGLSMAEYLAMPAVSASLVRTIIDRCPAAAWHDSHLNPQRGRETSKAMDRGTIAHGILLEGSTAGVTVIDPRDHPSTTTGAIPDGWTNKSIRTARDIARAEGKIPVLCDDMVAITGMVDAARTFIESLRDTERAIWAMFQPSGGESELTMVWQDGPTLCRLRADRVSLDRTIIGDYKTSAMSVEPDRWGRTQMVNMGYYIGAAWYRRGVKAVCGVETSYVWLCQESDPPYFCSLIGLDPHGFELGGQKVSAGLKMWQQGVRTGVWPAYPNRVCYPEIPAWEDARWMEKQQDCDEHGIPYDISKLFSRETT